MRWWERVFVSEQSVSYLDELGPEIRSSQPRAIRSVEYQFADVLAQATAKVEKYPTRFLAHLFVVLRGECWKYIAMIERMKTQIQIKKAPSTKARVWITFVRLITNVRDMRFWSSTGTWLYSAKRSDTSDGTDLSVA